MNTPGGFGNSDIVHALSLHYHGFVFLFKYVFCFLCHNGRLLGLGQKLFEERYQMLNTKQVIGVQSIVVGRECVCEIDHLYESPLFIIVSTD